MNTIFLLFLYAIHGNLFIYLLIRNNNIYFIKMKRTKNRNEHNFPAIFIRDPWKLCSQLSFFVSFSILALSIKC